jgi:sialate O-acetylesterase
MAVGLSAAAAPASVRLAGVFGDHMVLQRGVRLPVWGSADPGEEIAVSVAGRSASTTAGGDGRWRAELDPIADASSAPLEMTIRGNNTITLHDVLVGEVWLASGQSNMEYSLKGALNARQEVPRANHPQIRLADVGNHALLEPARDRELKWVACTPESASHFSAVAYFFARDLQEALHEPVGIIGAYVSGTTAQAWTPAEALRSSWVLAKYAAALSAAEASDKSAAGATRPAKISAAVPSSLYNGMIAPLIPCRITGVIWYQGESNVNDQEAYRTLFPAMISGWRKAWGEGDFPFIFVQLPGFGRRWLPDKGASWALMREAQTLALKLPNTAMAVTLDLVPKRALLHPKNKSGVGARLALAARGLAYGQDVADRSPSLDSFKIEGGKVRIRFRDAGGGMIAGTPPEENLHPSTTRPEKILGFTIAGADRKFVPAEAKAQADSVLVWNDQVPAPAAVRYGWKNNPDVNLYSEDGLPAAPFRTDDWPEPAPEGNTNEQAK